MKGVRAGILAGVYGLLLLLGTPGIDFLDDQGLGKVAEREKLISRIGPFWGSVGLGIYDVSQVMRQPLVKLIEPVQKPFRISQNWSLYRDGPGMMWRMEVYVDGGLVYRSVDEEYNWNEAVFRNRRVRPMVESSMQQVQAPNWRGLCGLVHRQVLEDFPEARQIDVVSMKSPFPGDKPQEQHRFIMKAPDFRPVLVEGR